MQIHRILGSSLKEALLRARRMFGGFQRYFRGIFQSRLNRRGTLRRILRQLIRRCDSIVRFGVAIHGRF